VPSGALGDDVKVSLAAVVVVASSGPAAFASGSTVVDLTVTSAATGAAITSFTAPLVIHFPAPEAGTPEYSRDGSSWTPIPELHSPLLPAGQADGYYRDADGSTDVYTRHATEFALLAPAAAVGITARLRGGTLTLSWRPATGGGTIVRYLILLDGTTVASTPATTISLHAFAAHQASRYQLVAVGDGGMQNTSTATVTVTRVSRPGSVPHRIPRWGWRLLAWQQQPAARRPTRPNTPQPLPAWYAAWRNWRLNPWLLHTS
jgi:hypothetical protein